MTHREACYELRRIGKRYERGAIDGDNWLAEVKSILAVTYGGAPAPQPPLSGGYFAPTLALHTSKPTGTRPLAAA